LSRPSNIRAQRWNFAANRVRRVAEGCGIINNEEDLGNRAVNFRDFAVLAEDWLKEELFP
jgi:hypothetical protein